MATLRNEASQTNKTYCKLRKRLNESIDERMAGAAGDEDESPSKKIDDGVYESGMGLKGDLGGETATYGKEGKTEEADDSDDELGLTEDEKIPAWPCLPPFLIQENGTFRKNWEIIIIFLALYNALMIPLQLFF